MFDFSQYPIPVAKWEQHCSARCIHQNRHNQTRWRSSRFGNSVGLTVTLANSVNEFCKTTPNVSSYKTFCLLGQLRLESRLGKHQQRTDKKKIAPCRVNAMASATIVASGGPGKKRENNAETEPSPRRMIRREMNGLGPLASWQMVVCVFPLWLCAPNDGTPKLLRLTCGLAQGAARSNPALASCPPIAMFPDRG